MRKRQFRYWNELEFGVRRVKREFGILKITVENQGRIKNTPYGKACIKMKMDESLNLKLPTSEFNKLPPSAFPLPNSIPSVICHLSSVTCYLSSVI
jgi:hypothetical protein